MATEEEIVELEPYEAAEDSVDDVDEPRTIPRWVQYALCVLTLPWVAVFVVATQISPYQNEPSGEARRMGTHMQLGLPDCNFKEFTGFPCPSCGMTTSFCCLIRADLWHSLQANFAGTVLASLGMLFIPWALASAFCGRFVFVRSLEMVVFRLALMFLCLLFGRWALVLLWELTMKS